MSISSTNSHSVFYGVRPVVKTQYYLRKIPVCWSPLKKVGFSVRYFEVVSKLSVLSPGVFISMLKLVKFLDN